ncbi:tetratricopeptide repeat protein [Euhalothece natronophila Z-M001]|uniref:Tetratricopeptide repeat protein n=1 Tax=Euhalothece natronophila Z-M001 TaxID=522448 RepID=A0A5B8NPB3_9CHRO|nr:tetratricopeptide repeat protein [Euhalothece natronophila]QDZ41112.1 tetratricopeptide repeat protein [Euhalothece natronophila Z-M001]
MPTIPPIKCGLFQFDITDYHAILGVPLGASPEEVRKNYLKVTRILFPDVRKLETQEEEKLADQLLSKLVNPSYETLVKDQAARRDYLLVLDQISDRASNLGESILKSKAAKELLSSGETKIDLNYRKYLNTIAKKEYQEIHKTLERIALISEFNLVYLMLKSDKLTTETTPSSATQKTSQKEIEEVQKENQETTPEETTANLIDPYLRRAQNFINKKDYQKAVIDLREALKIDSKNAKAHTLLGLAYVKQNQLGMAKVHINKALQLDPENEMALEGKQVLQRLSGDSKGSNSSGKKESKEKSNKGGGLLGGLFGKKKKK